MKVSGMNIDIKNNYTKVEDSGKRENFDTGSVRDTREGKGRYDLIPFEGLFRLAVHYENGAKKYGDRNWEKGQPLMRYLDSAMRHLAKLIDKQDTEDHAAAVAWNMFAFMATKKWIDEGILPDGLNNWNK